MKNLSEGANKPLFTPSSSLASAHENLINMARVNTRALIIYDANFHVTNINIKTSLHRGIATNQL